MQTITYAPRPFPFIVTNGGAAAATGAPLVAAGGQAWVPTSGGGFIIQSPTASQMDVYPVSSPGKKKTTEFIIKCLSNAA